MVEEVVVVVEVVASALISRNRATAAALPIVHSTTTSPPCTAAVAQVASFLVTVPAVAIAAHAVAGAVVVPRSNADAAGIPCLWLRVEGHRAAALVAANGAAVGGLVDFLGVAVKGVDAEETVEAAVEESAVREVGVVVVAAAGEANRCAVSSAPRRDAASVTAARAVTSERWKPLSALLHPFRFLYMVAGRYYD